MVKQEEEQPQQQPSMEAQIERGLHSRMQHFKDKADSLTLESVRRLLEEDLGLEKYALDVHKKLIKRLLEKLMEDPKHDDVSNNSEKDLEKNASSIEAGAEKSPRKNETKKNLKQPVAEDEMKTEDSPVMGLMTTNVDSVEAETSEPTESSIKKAISDRASYIMDNSETITPAGVRRLLEEDMGLPANALDPFKRFIRTQIDQVLESSEVFKPAAGSEKKKSSANSQIDVSEKDISGTSSGSSDFGNEEVDVKVKSRKKEAAPRRNIDKSKALKKRKAPPEEVNVSRKKQQTSKKPSAEEDDGSGSDDVQSEISSERTSKPKQISTPGYGKRVDKLRSVIKACGMSVAPTVYKKAKQVPDDKREAFLIKELEGILSREGLSANPSEKEIKEVKKRKETAKELEGIDLSNIVTSSRRRASVYMAPPKPKVLDEGRADKPKSSKKKDDGDAVSGVQEEKEDKKEDIKGKEEEKEDKKKGNKGEENEGKDDDSDNEDDDEEENEDDDEEENEEENDSDDSNSASEEFNDDDDEDSD